MSVSDNGRQFGPAAGDREPAVPFAEAFATWLKIGLIGFGGPAGQIALMHRILVEEKRWLSENRFLHALNYCMLLPGPEAQQLAVYAGWLLHRTWGGLVAGVLFVLPGAIVILGLSLLYAGLQELPLVQALFYGIKTAVLAVVIEAVLRIGKRALRGPGMVAIAAAAFMAIFAFDVPFPAIVAAAAVIGFLSARVAPRQGAPRDAQGDADRAASAGAPRGLSAALRRSAWVVGVCGLLWLGPVAALLISLGPDNVFAQEAVFFSKMAVVTFGGAYAVLAYVAQEAVATYGWLAPGEMLDGLGLAETTPGPLIMVVQFVGFLGAYRNPGLLEPWVAGTLGALITTWVTFVPCFLWIFLGAPFIESLRNNRWLNAALSAITAAVVGVVLNLAIWFALHVLFGALEDWRAGPVSLLVPRWQSLDPVALVLAAGALLAMLRFKAGMLPTLGACALLGGLWFHFAA